MRAVLQPTFMALAVAAALHVPAYAAPVVSADTAASANGVAGTTTLFTAPGYAGSSSNAEDGLNQAFSYGFANQYGAYAVNSSARGVADASANAQLRYTVTNTTSIAQSVSMSFHIYGGSISTFLNSGASLILGESLSSLYSASISVNGTSLFSSSATLTRTDAGTSLVRTGQQLNDFGDDGTDGVYSWGSGDYVIDLGILDAGQSLEVLANVSNASTANVGTYDFSTGGTGYGYGYGGYGGYGYEIPCDNITASDSPVFAALVAIDGCGSTGTAVKGGSESFYGDPIEFNFSGTANQDGDVTVASFSLTEPNAVPEPGSLGLIGLALGAAALVRRPRRKA